LEIGKAIAAQIPQQSTLMEMAIKN
jgi:hypothetical protein